MIIGVDAGCLGVSDERLKVGVYRMAQAFLTELLKIDKKNLYKLYSFIPINKNLIQRLGDRAKNIIIKPSYGWLTVWLPLELKRNPVDVFLGFSQSLPKLPPKTKSIVFIHDLTFEKNPAWFKNSYKKMSNNSKWAVKKADHIIAVSKATKKDLVDIYYVDSSKISVIYEGFDNRLKKLPETLARKRLIGSGVARPFFLFVGTFKQSKNIPNIIRAFSIFLKSQKEFQLVLVGSDYWLDPEIKMVIKRLNLKDKVKMLGFVSDWVLEALYSNAAAFVSPSFNEGFGLTHLEAARLKVPIITSRKGSIEEVLNGGAIYVNPDQPESIAMGMEKAVVEEKLSQEIISKSYLISRRFSWQNSAKKLLQIINTYGKR